MKVTFPFSHGDNDFMVTAEVSPIIPAVLYPNDKAHPEEGGEVEILDVELQGKFAPWDVYARVSINPRRPAAYMPLEELMMDAAREVEPE